MAGRPPIGKRAMTAAERQRRHREALRAAAEAAIRARLERAFKERVRRLEQQHAERMNQLEQEHRIAQRRLKALLHPDAAPPGARAHMHKVFVRATEIFERKSTKRK